MDGLGYLCATLAIGWSGLAMTWTGHGLDWSRMGLAMDCTWVRLALGWTRPWLSLGCVGSAIVLPGGEEPMDWFDHGLGWPWAGFICCVRRGLGSTCSVLAVG
jgi:hypothetical protein